MNRSEMLLVALGALGVIMLLAAAVLVRAIVLRRRRKRQAAQAWRLPKLQDDSGIEAVRREADESHQRYIKRQAEVERQRLEAEWLRDGGHVLTERKKPPEETS